jgi:hypothetical protein
MKLIRSVQHRLKKFNRNRLLNRIKKRVLSPDSLASSPEHGVAVWEYSKPTTLRIGDNVTKWNQLGQLPDVLQNAVGIHHFPQPYVAELQNVLLSFHRVRDHERFFPFATTQSKFIVVEATSGKQQTFGPDYVWDRLKTPELERLLKIDQQPIEREIDTAYVVTPERTFYYSLLCEVIPRFEGLDHYTRQTGHTPAVFLPEGSPSFFEQYIELFGYPVGRYSFETMAVKRLIIPSWRQEGTLTSPATIAWLKQRLLPVVADRRKHEPPFNAPYVYISRRKAARQVANEEDLFEDCLHDAGFVSYVMEDMPVIDQIALMAQAEFLVGPHGGGFANLMFCQPGRLVLEMFSETWIADYFFAMAQANGMHYGNIVNKVDSEDRAIVNLDDFRAVFDPMIEQHLSRGKHNNRG